MQKSFAKLVIVTAAVIMAMSVNFAQQVLMIDETGTRVFVVQNEHYATFLTLATFEGISYKECLGLTSLCPNECGHSGNMASFNIDQYLAFGKFNEFGDGKDGRFLVLLDNGDGTTPLVDQIVYNTMRALNRDEKVLLSWNHIYTIKQSGEFTMQFPDRPINFILPLTDAQAKLIPTVPVPTAPDGFEGVLNRYYVSLTKFGGMVEGHGTFNIERHLFTYYYNDLATREFLSTYVINPKTTHKDIVREMNKLKKDNFALIAFRRDIIDRNIISTPLFVIPLSNAEAVNLLNN